jgi:hypothetical protein
MSVHRPKTSLRTEFHRSATLLCVFKEELFFFANHCKIEFWNQLPQIAITYTCMLRFLRMTIHTLFQRERVMDLQQQRSLLSQASWGRLEMKPKRDEKQGDT